MKKTTLLLSGGPDSVTLAHILNQNYNVVHGITFLHNPMGSNFDEVNSAKYFASKLGLIHKIFDVSFLYELYKNDPNYKFSLGGAKDCIPNGLKQTPLSVHLMLNMAAMYSISNGIHSLNWGIHQDDFIGTTEKEIDKLIYLSSELISDELGKPFKILTPFKEYHKKDIIEKGNYMGINFDKTISCFVSENDNPCGKCIKCVERNIAFENSNLTLKSLWHEK